jgi:hypothetical protein
VNCFWCDHPGEYVCPRCYADTGLNHTHEQDYMCDACGGFVGEFLTKDELTLRLANIQAFKDRLRAEK